MLRTAAETKMNDEHQKELRCTFEDAERNNLLAGIRMSTRAKVELFEEMLDFAWRTGALKPHEQDSTKQ